MHTAIVQVKKAIVELSAVSTHLKRKGRKSEVVSMCLSYAHALLEFLYTSSNNVHMGRLRNGRRFYSNNIERMLLEDTKNPRVRQFIHKMEAYLTPELRIEFYSSELRRKPTRRQIHRIAVNNSVRILNYVMDAPVDLNKLCEALNDLTVHRGIMYKWKRGTLYIFVKDHALEYRNYIINTLSNACGYVPNPVKNFA